VRLAGGVLDKEKRTMDITQLPFNRLLGLEAEPNNSTLLVSLPSGPQFTNHIGTIHASALLAVAEAGSGEFLLRHLGSMAGFVPVVRRLEATFRKPATGRIFARAAIPTEQAAQWSTVLTTRDRVLAVVPIEVVDADGVIVMSAVVEWLIARSRPSAQQANQ
jgi:acyl-coenzyme A thioesterase PaaI-like protein